MYSAEMPLTDGLPKYASASSSPYGSHVVIPMSDLGNSELAAELERIRDKLLDVSKLNPLINFRRPAKRTLELAGVEPDALFARLVADRKPLRLQPAPEVEVAANGDASASHGSEAARSAQERQRSRLTTSLPAKQFAAHVNRLRNEANKRIDETGVNYFFLALGMLHWTEREDSNVVFQAPLILAPVQLDKQFDERAGEYAFKVQWTEEEVRHNLSLARLLEVDHGLTLPSFREGLDEEGDETPEEYFRSVADVIQRKTAWRIERECLLGFFQFHKLLMFHDLAPEKWEDATALERGSLVDSIVLGADVSADSGSLGKLEYHDDYAIDEDPRAAEVVLVNDADSSQHSALIDIAAGKSLVIEGPPGTGKSQTITNAIAAAIHQGKNVLFVAEKLAALKVVEDRLANLGLGEFCLSLHSDTASPRQVFDSLDRRLRFRAKPPQEIEATRARLEDKKRILTEYLDATARRVGPYEEPLYALLGRLISLRSKQVGPLRKALNVRPSDQVGFHAARDSLRDFATAYAETQTPQESPWWGFFPTEVDPYFLEPVRRQLAELAETSGKLGSGLQSLVQAFGGGAGDWLSAAEQSTMQALLKLADHPPQGGARKLSALHAASARSAAISLAEVVDELQARHRECRGFLLSEFSAAARGVARVQQAANALTPLFGDAPLIRLKRAAATMRALVRQLQRVERVGQAIAAYGLGPLRNVVEFEKNYELFRWLHHAAVADASTVTPDLFLDATKDLLRSAIKRCNKLQEASEELASQLDLAAAPDTEELQALAGRLRPYVGSWLAFTRSEFRAARRDLQRFGAAPDAIRRRASLH